MTIRKLTDPAFKKYGIVLEDYDFGDFIQVLKETPLPETGIVYVASDPKLEAHPIFTELRDRTFGGMPIQLGYCDGRNRKLNCLEYHKGSEVSAIVDDTIILLGIVSDIEDGQYDTAKVEAFFVPAGTAIELYATTLHYAPCCAEAGKGFKVAICLPAGTNGDYPVKAGTAGEDRFLRICNKWLIVHPESDEAKAGAYVGLVGENITL